MFLDELFDFRSRILDEPFDFIFPIPVYHDKGNRPRQALPSRLALACGAARDRLCHGSLELAVP